MERNAKNLVVSGVCSTVAQFLQQLWGIINQITPAVHFRNFLKLNRLVGYLQPCSLFFSFFFPGGSTVAYWILLIFAIFKNTQVKGQQRPRGISIRQQINCPTSHLRDLYSGATLFTVKAWLVFSSKLIFFIQKHTCPISPEMPHSSSSNKSIVRALRKPCPGNQELQRKHLQPLKNNSIILFAIGPDSYEVCPFRTKQCVKHQ